MKSIFIFIFLFSLTGVSGQIDKTELKKFFAKVDCIQLVELEPVMIVDTIFIEEESQLKVELDTLYFAESILKTDEVDSIDLSRVGNRKHGFLELFQEIEVILLNNLTDTEVVLSCYNPRNGILFYDKRDKLIGYLEICFQCSGHAEYLMPYLILNHLQYEKLKDIFLREGVH